MYIYVGTKCRCHVEVAHRLTVVWKTDAIDVSEKKDWMVPIGL